MTTPDLSAPVDRLRREVPGLVAVYLFGSAAHGTNGPQSDLDLAVLAGRPLDPVRRFDVQENLAAALGHDVDLVDLRVASTVFQMQVVSTGRVLLDADRGARAAFETFVYSAYALLNEERAGVLEAIRQRGRVYG